MLSGIILAIILVTLVIQDYLNSLRTFGWLPMPFGFLGFFSIFFALLGINAVWMFGFWYGIPIFALAFFRIFSNIFLWPARIPLLINVKKYTIFGEQEKVTVNSFVYGCFPILTLSLMLLTVVNFLISDYASVAKIINTFLKDDYTIPILFAVVFAVVSLITKEYTLRKLENMYTQEETENKDSE